MRFSRSVRAEGFRDKAFEKLLGHARYRWMPSLGNANIGSNMGKMRIQCPNAVEQLLDLVIDAAAANRRVIFFCSCDSPRKGAFCHRAKVAKLLIRAGRRRSVALQTQEWPGGFQTRKIASSLKVTDDTLRRVLQGAARVALTPRQITPDLMCLPHGSLIELKASSARQLISVQSPEYRAKRWYLPLFVTPCKERRTPAELWSEIISRRKEFNLEPCNT